MPATRFLVGGQVQGVFFRASAREQAVRLGLSGYARNLADGRVEVVAIGDAARIDAFASWLREGPPLARVEAFDRSDIDEPEATDGFSIR